MRIPLSLSVADCDVIATIIAEEFEAALAA
jgi:hypothetical protein